MSRPASGAAETVLARVCARAHARARLLVAVSGGADSVALLHILRFERDVPAGQLVAAHFDHGMRPGSAADADWVRGLCSAWEVPLRSGSAPAALRGETAARAARWAFLLDSACAAEADVILTAHHADDQAETLLFRIARGTGLPGLAGIPERRRVVHDGRQILIVRPMLGVTRAELRAYCDAQGLRFREDPTNAQPGTARNRIRATLLPALERQRPGASARLAAIARAAVELEHAWRAVIRDVAREAVLERSNSRIVLAREVLLGYDPQVRTRLLRHELRRLGQAPGRTGTRAVDEFINTGRSGKGIGLSGGVRIERERDRIVLRRTQARSEDKPLRIMAPDSGAGLALIGGRRLHAHWSMDPERRATATIEFDPAALTFPLEMRAWRAGDRIRFDYGSKKLKKLFLERGIGRAERSRTPVLADAAGRILWVRGIARAHGCEPVAGAAGFHLTVVDE